MANTGITGADALAVAKFRAESYQEYLKSLKLKEYMGTDPMSMIHMVEDLAKDQGDNITIPLVGALSGDGVSGDSTLEGNEESLSTYSQVVTVTQVRNAVRSLGRLSNKRYPFQIVAKFRPSLIDWSQQKTEDDVFTAMGSINGVNYSAASEAQKDAWLAANADRILFGAAVSNNSSNDHSNSLGNVDSTTDILNCAHLTLAKRLAKLANPKLRPIRMESGEEVFVYWAHPYSTRDLKNDQNWQDAQMHAGVRGDSNRLFTGALGMYDGVIVVESERVPLLAGVGNGSCDVAQGFLCGAQAVVWAQGGVDGSRMSISEKDFDYDNQVGVAIAMMYKAEKARFATGASAASKDHGIVTCYTAAVAD